MESRRKICREFRGNKDATLRTPLDPADPRPRSNPRIFQHHSSCSQQHLRKNRVPWYLEESWIGHANKDVTDKYAAQLKEDVEWRENVAEKAGLGFALPACTEISIGQLGQPEIIGSEEAKAA